jgi:hypothetical protein
MREFQKYIPGLKGHQDLSVIASYASQCIEKFGTGGGNFRLMYAGFLREAHKLCPKHVDASLADLADQSAAAWTEMSGHLASIAADETGEVDAALDGCRDAFSRVIDLETRLFEQLHKD